MQWPLTSDLRHLHSLLKFSHDIPLAGDPVQESWEAL